MYHHKEPWKKHILFHCSITLKNQTKRRINVTITSTLLSRMKLHTFIKWTSPFSSSGLLGVVFHLYSNFNRTSCKQTVENLISHCIFLHRTGYYLDIERFNHMNRHGVCQMWDRNRYDVFVMARINICFNDSFLDFNQYCK